MLVRVMAALIAVSAFANVSFAQSDDEKAKKLLEKIEKLISDHYSKLGEELKTLIKNELARSSGGGEEIDKEVDAFCQNIVPNLKEEGITADLKKFMQTEKGKGWLKQRFAESFKRGMKSTQQWVDGVFDKADDKYVVKKQVEPSVRKLLENAGVIQAQPAKKPGYLGITLDDSFDDVKRKEYGLGSGEGVKLASVKAGSPAEKSGLKAGHIVVKINGAKVSETGLRDILGKYSAGDEIDVLVITEDKKEETIKVKLGEKQ